MNQKGGGLSEIDKLKLRITKIDQNLDNINKTIIFKDKK